MNILTKMTSKAAFLAIALFAAVLVTVSGSASARTPYNSNGTATSTTPVLNEFYNVPNGIGDEADFVRIKPKAGTNADYVDTLNAACNTGDSYNVRTYLHNGASPDFNDNGSGSAVAHNVMVQLKAELGSAQSKFKFASTVTSSNMAGATDTAYLNCGSKTVKLSLVANSVQTYSKSLGFQGESDSAVNGAPFKVGSRVHGSGDQWACWDDRITVYYEVKVEEVPVVIPSDAICKLEDGQFIVVDNKKRTVSGTIVPELTNATVLEYKIEWGDGSVTNNQSGTHTYAKDGNYHIQASMLVRLNGTNVQGENPRWVDGPSCATTVEFKPGKPPVVVVPSTPTTLVHTGAANTFGIFAAVTAIGAVLHRLYTARKFNA